MKRFPVLVAFHLLAIVSLCFIVAWTYEQSLAWTSAVFFAIAIALSFNSLIAYPCASEHERAAPYVALL